MFKGFLRHNFPKLYATILFYKYHGYKLNIIEPVSFSHKIMYRKANWNDQRYVDLSDKVKVKDHVARLIGNQYVNPSIGVYDDLSIVQLKEVIKEYGELFIKANHNSGPVYRVCPLMDDDKLRYILNDIHKQLKVDFGEINQEPWYSHIKRKILLEKRLYDAGRDDLLDYKFHVFNDKGRKTIFLQVDYDRNSNHSRSFFDVELNWIPFTTEYPIVYTKIDKPENYDLMIEFTKILSLDFEYVRVDFYNLSGRIVFGELTFAHGSGLERFNHREYDFWLGKFWKK